MIRNRKIKKISTPVKQTVKIQKRRRKQIVKKIVQPVQIEKKRIKSKSNNYSTNREIGKVEKIFKNETIFLIGGGPSLKKFDWNLLNGKRTIAINKAILTYPNADVLYWTDSRFYNWYKKQIDQFTGPKYTIRNGPYDDSITLLKKGIKYGLEEAPSSLSHGNNSGYAAMNLAYHLGAKKIILLGYDMGNINNESHYHGGYPTKATSNEVYDKQFIPGFTKIGDLLKSKGIEIYNASLISKLNCFPKITFQKALSIR